MVVGALVLVDRVGEAAGPHRRIEADVIALAAGLAQAGYFGLPDQRRPEDIQAFGLYFVERRDSQHVRCPPYPGIKCLIPVMCNPKAAGAAG